MHKRMLQLSARYDALPENKRTVAMRDALYEAQANDAYWHGLFGGLYLPHLRRAVYNAIVRLEGLLDQAASRPPREECDFDLDGCDELFLHNGVLQAVVLGDGSASVGEFDAYALQHNFGDTLARRQEHYHRKIGHGRHDGGQSGAIANPHERVSFKHEIRPEDLATDDYRRSLFLDRLYAGNPGDGAPLRYRPSPGGKGMSAAFETECGGGRIRKQIELQGNVLCVEYLFDGDFRGMFEVELNLAMPSCDGPAGCFKVAGHVTGGFGQPQQLAMCREISLHDEVLGGQLTLTADHPAALRSAPCFSVSQSEAGFEKIMQAVTLHLSWPAEDIGRRLALRLAVA